MLVSVGNERGSLFPGSQRTLHWITGMICSGFKAFECMKYIKWLGCTTRTARLWISSRELWSSLNPSTEMRTLSLIWIAESGRSMLL